MDRSDSQSQPQRTAGESHEPRREAAAPQPLQRAARETREPADLRFEPQLEEPGYGHGV